MANKVGILNGILLVFLNIFAEIPLGVSFSLGVTSFTGIPLMFAHDGLTAVYAWGTSTSGWWFNLGIAGIAGLSLEFILLVSCILSFIGSWIQGDKGRKLLGAILIMELVGFIFIIVDIFAIGTLGIKITLNQILTNVGLGIYLFIIIIILQIIAVKIHNNQL